MTTGEGEDEGVMAMRLAMMLGMVALAGAVAGCTPAPQVATGPVIDPYADTADGGAVYRGDVAPPGTGAARAVLPGTATPEAFALAGNTVLFARDQVALSAEGRAVVAGQAQWLTRNAGFTAVVEGHADEEGTADYNLALGARRAASVQEYLIAQGVAAGRISTVSYGRERPLEACSTEACFARNRRAVTTVSPAVGV